MADRAIKLNVDTDFGPDEVMDYIQQFQNMKYQKLEANRAKDLHAITMANQKYMEDTREKTKLAANSLNKWSSAGIDILTTGNPDITASLGQNFDYQSALQNAWKGYSNDLQSIGQVPSPAVFRQNFDMNYKANLDMAANRFKALKETVGIQRGITDDRLLNRILAKEYNANNLYKAYSVFASPDEAMQALNYAPEVEPKGWAEKAKSFLRKQKYTDPETGESLGGGLTGSGGAMGLGALAGVGEVGRRSYTQFGLAKDEILKQAKLDAANYAQKREKITKGKNKGKMRVVGTKPGSGLTGGKDGKFFEKYNMLKKEAFVDGKPTDRFIKKANELARRETTAGKILARGKKYGGFRAGVGAGGWLGGELGEAIGGDIGGIAGTLTGAGVGAQAGRKAQRGIVEGVKKLSDPKTLTRLRKWAAGKGSKSAVKKQLMKALGKLGVSAAGYLGPQAVEPISTVAGLAGTAWAGYDIYKLAMQVPELMDVIFKED